MSAILYNKPKYKQNNKRPLLLRIVVSSDYTRIDFGYQTDPIYVRGGWVTMNPKTFLRIKNNEKLTLRQVENIPLGPTKHNFESTVDSMHFSLYFPPLPEGVLKFDLIEEEPDTPNIFNYYDIILNKKEGIPILTKI